MLKKLITLFSLIFMILPTQAKSEDNGMETAIFAAGCFWCIEKPFDTLDGVISTVVGYTDGQTKNPDYKSVSSGSTGHTEAMQVTYNPNKVTYEELLDVFWRNHDPCDVTGQFCDRGTQYRPGIYYDGEAQKVAAFASKAKYEKILGKELLTEIKAATTFYKGEEYHQNYYLKNPVRYKYYRWSCGRDQRLEEIWDGK
jgi:peptide-methionine (S)-S-oxide reductase